MTLWRATATAPSRKWSNAAPFTVEETLNALLDAEADHLAEPGSKRAKGRKGARAGAYDRHLQTKACEVTLTVPTPQNLPFETAITERCRRRESSSVEGALIEMYLAGVSVRRVENITQVLRGTRVSASTVSDVNQEICGKIDRRSERPLVGDFPYVFLDLLWLKRI
jgi:transposase-like protein